MPSEPIPATLIPGDGIGQEIVDATLAALEALEVKFDWDIQTAGLRGVKTAGDPLPKATLESIRRTRLALKGPLETPSGGGYRSSNVRLREEFKLYANLRPSRTIVPGGRYDNIDLIVVRENNEGLYMGYEHLHPDRRRPARGRDVDGREHAARQPQAPRIRLRVRDRPRPQEDHDRPQGQHHEGPDGHLPRDGPRALREEVQGQDRRSTTASSTRAR